jgi:hypothetical protein
VTRYLLTTQLLSSHPLLLLLSPTVLLPVPLLSVPPMTLTFRLLLVRVRNLSGICTAAPIGDYCDHFAMVLHAGHCMWSIARDNNWSYRRLVLCSLCGVSLSIILPCYGLTLITLLISRAWRSYGSSTHLRWTCPTYMLRSIANYGARWSSTDIYEYASLFHYLPAARPSLPPDCLAHVYLSVTLCGRLPRGCSRFEQ